MDSQNPILIDEHRTVLAGHGRVAAAKLLELGEVPCIRLSNMRPAQKPAYVIADNKLALNAGWDEEILANELHSILELDLDFDIELIGFSTPEIDGLVAPPPNRQNRDFPVGAGKCAVCASWPAH